MKNVPKDAGHIERDYLYQIPSFFYSNHEHLSIILFLIKGVDNYRF